jgi:hypothetical protein
MWINSSINFKDISKNKIVGVTNFYTKIVNKIKKLDKIQINYIYVNSE